ncbi:MAG: hypothetical protein ACLQVI_03345 [Polyangiaceae bacterium]
MISTTTISSMSVKPAPVALRIAEAAVQALEALECSGARERDGRFTKGPLEQAACPSGGGFDPRDPS